MDKTYLFPAGTLSGTARDVLLAAGSPAEEAALVADRLLAANLAGHDSHGIIRLH